MGLDMYLIKKIYIGGNFDHNKVNGVIAISRGDKEIKVNLKKVTYITEDAGYWRKANAIHAWFVKNVQDGVDDCREYEVSYNQLLELKALCIKVLETNDTSLLPPQDGFFFGSTEIDECYFDDLKLTVEIINTLDPEANYEYHSSW
jgi:hypothetical protein